MGYTDSLGILKSFKSSDKVIFYYSLPELEKKGLGKISTLPFSIRVVLESLARNLDGKIITERDVRLLACKVLHKYPRNLERDIGVFREFSVPVG